MEHNGLFTDLDSSFASLSSTNNFNDPCPTVLPSLNSFKYPHANLSSNFNQHHIPTTTSIQSATVIDHHQQQQQHHQHHSQTIKSSSSSSSGVSTGIPQTQININNCNNNIIFPLDDGLFADPATSLSIGAGTTPVAASVVTQQTNGNTNHASGNSSNTNQKNNFIGYLRKDTGSSVSCSGGGGGGGGENITYNINNINTNIVNNVVNNTDIFTGNQYHQISKPAALGETIINFTNSNLNSTGSGTTSMPVDTGSVTSQNFYNYQTNNNIIQGHQQPQQQSTTIFETNLQSQQQSQQSQPQSAQQQHQQPTDSYDLGNMGLFPGNYGKYPAFNTSVNQKTASSYIPNGTQQDFPAAPQAPTAVNVTDPLYGDFQDPVASKIITSFETKNPLKYPSAASNSRSNGSYYGKSVPEYQSQFGHLPPHPSHHLPPHGYPNMYPSNGHTKVQQSHNYPETYVTMQPRSAVPTAYPPHYKIEDPTKQSSMSRHHAYHPAMQSHGHPSATNSGVYGNFYPGNTFNSIPHYPPAAYQHAQPIPPSQYHAKPSASSYTKSSAMSIAPVEHGNYPPMAAMTKNYANSKKEFYKDGPYYQHHQMHANYYEDPKKKIQSVSHRGSLMPPEMYANHAYADPHHMIPPANLRYQQMPKPPTYNGVPSYPPQNSIDLGYHAYPHHKMNPKMNPHPPPMSAQQYHHYDPMMQHHMQSPYHYHPSMASKPSEKIKISIDLEEQINSSKITKMSHNPPYGYEPSAQHPGHYYHHPQPIYHPHHPTHPHPSHMMANRNMMHGDSKTSSISNINISIRDFLQSWNDDEEESARHVDEERTIRREYNPLFVQKASMENFVNNQSSNNFINNDNTTPMSNIDGNEKLYVLEKYDVPISELNKLKHLTIINKLPENIVIAGDKEQLFPEDIDDIDLTRVEKLYKSEFELEFEACHDDGKNLKPPTMDETVSDQQMLKSEKCENVVTIDLDDEKPLSNEVEKIPPCVSVSEDKKQEENVEDEKIKKPIKVKVSKDKLPKIKQQILKMKKDKIFKTAKEQRKVRITKRMKKYSLNPRSSSLVRSLQSICVDFVNTSQYRNFARTQLSIINKRSKKRVLEDFKKKFNFDGMKKQTTTPINQKLNHSVRINSLTEICGKFIKNKARQQQIEDDDDDDDVFSSRDEFEEEIIYDDIESESLDATEVPTLKNMCKQFLANMNYDVVENDNFVFNPPTLYEICGTYIYNTPQYFNVVEEEVEEVPRLDELCNGVLSDENLYVTNEAESSVEEMIPAAENTDSSDPIYIVEENSGNVGELFETESLNTFEKTELLRRIQRAANIDDDDEIMRAIGALHVDPIIDNNNECDVSNKNIQGRPTGGGNESVVDNESLFSDANELSMLNANDMKFDSEMAFYDDLLHSVQYEEILNDDGHKTSNNTMEILRHKNLNCSEKRQRRKAVGKIIKKSVKFQRRRPVTRQRNGNVNAEMLTTAPNKLTESHFIDDAKARQQKVNMSNDDSTKTISRTEANIFVDKNPIRAESNLPKLPSALPSINEYRLERKSNHRNSIKDKSTIHKYTRKLSFEESLLKIEKKMMTLKNGDASDSEDYHKSTSRRRRSSSSSQHRHEKSSSSRRHHHRHKTSRSHRSNGHRRHRSRSRSRESSSRRRKESHHKSSREKSCYKKDQIKHSEAKRLVIPSYKLYDKDLDIKLKTMPYVKVEREEVDEMMKRLI